MCVTAKLPGHVRVGSKSDLAASLKYFRFTTQKGEYGPDWKAKLAAEMAERSAPVLKKLFGGKRHGKGR